jgi:hypothetical protein
MDDKEKIRKMKKTENYGIDLFPSILCTLCNLSVPDINHSRDRHLGVCVCDRVDVGAGGSGLVIQEYRSMGELKYLVQEHSTSLTRWCLHHAWKAEFEWERGHYQVHF